MILCSKVLTLAAIVPTSHEYYDGHSLYRYVNQTDWERFLSPSTARTDNLGGVSTATTPLHHLLAFGSHHAAGSAGYWGSAGRCSAWYGSDPDRW